MSSLHRACFALPLVTTICSCSVPTDALPSHGDPSDGITSPPMTHARSSPKLQALPPYLAAARGSEIAFVSPNGELLASASTDLPVTDLAEDSINHRWIALELGDDAACQLTAWRLAHEDRAWTVQRAGTAPCEGMGRLYATSSGMMLVARDYPQSRWSLLNSALVPLWQVRAPFPSSMFPAHLPGTTHRSIEQADNIDGPSATLVAWSASADGLERFSSTSLGPPWSTLDAVRACALGTSEVGLATLHEGFFSAAFVTDSSLASSHSAFVETAARGAVVDVACDDRSKALFAVLSDPGHAIVIRVDRDTIQVSPPATLPGILGRGAWPTRHLALARDRTRLYVGTDRALTSLDAARIDGPAVWRSAMAHAPVALAVRKEDGEDEL